MMEGITIIVLEEILMANGLTVLMMWFLLFCRRKNRESLHVGDKIYDGIAIVNLVVCTWNCVSIEIIKEWFKKQEWRYFPGW